MPFFDPIRIGASGAVADYTVDRSLRFNTADAPMLSRTPSSNGNRRTFTWSGWVKRSKPDSSRMDSLFGSTTEVSSGNSNTYLTFYQDKIYTNSYNYATGTAYTLQTTQVFRDPSAWYHVVWAVDTTQSTSSNRIKIYVNGEQITSFSTETYPSQNYQGLINSSSYKMTMGRIFPSLSNTAPLDGYMAEINFIDGYQYDPSYFGETNAATGQWVAKKYAGAYGTNGFYLNFSDNSGTTATTMGKDSSGNGNNFTPNNLVTGDAVKDTPTNNFCTLNPLNATNDVDLREGNLEFFQSSNDESATSTFGITSGKWYWEVYKNSSQNPELGIDTLDLVLSNKSDNVSSTKVCFRTNGGDQQVGTGTPTSITGSSGGQTGAGVIAIAVDFDNKKIWYSDLSGNFFNSGNPATGSNAAFDFSSVAVANGCVPYFFCGTGGNNSFNINFGQDGTFAGHTTAGGYADGNGHGNFKYSVPSGYLALCSANLPDPTIKLPNQHFDTVTYTGSGSGNQSITSLNFQPDWVWLKNRTSGWHALVDSVRGVGKILASNETAAENNSSNSQTAFSAFLSNGFTVGYNTSWYVNGSPSGTNTQVAWNWNAGDTDGKTYTVTVVSDSGNKYRFDGFGTSAVTLDLAEGGTYIFDQSDSSNAGHPLRFYTAADKTGGEYTTGVTTAGTPGSSGAYTQIVVAASAPTLFYQCSVHAGMGGQANTNSTLGSSNFDGNNQSTVKVNATAGFSIVSYTGTGANNTNVTMGHGLGVKPDAVIIKNRTRAVDWVAWIDGVGGSATDNQKNLALNTTAAAGQNSSQYRTSDSTTIAVRDTDSNGNNKVNRSGDNYISYVFSSVAGYSKFGSYTGNGNSNGTFVFTGFKVQFLLIKKTNTTESWILADTKRNSITGRESPADSYLLADQANAESTGIIYDMLSNGFKFRSTSQNTSGHTYVYFAFAEAPFKNARAR